MGMDDRIIGGMPSYSVIFFIVYTSKPYGATRQNFFINFCDNFFERFEMLTIDPFAGWQAHGHGVNLPVIYQNFIM